jgi:regulatory protein
MDDDLLQKILNKAYFFLKFRPRTEKEITSYLSKKFKGAKEEIIEIAIEKLKSQNLINDKDFIQWYVEQRVSFRPKSQLILKKELLNHGVDKDLIEDFFNQNPLNEEKLAFEALKNKWHRFKNLNFEEKFLKAIGFLLRRGFNYSIARKTFNKILKLNN